MLLLIMGLAVFCHHVSENTHDTKKNICTIMVRNYHYVAATCTTLGTIFYYVNKCTARLFS